MRVADAADCVTAITANVIPENIEGTPVEVSACEIKSNLESMPWPQRCQ